MWVTFYLNKYNYFTPIKSRRYSIESLMSIFAYLHFQNVSTSLYPRCRHERFVEIGKYRSNLSDLMIFVAHISAALNKPIGGGQALTNSILILVIFVTHILYPRCRHERPVEIGKYRSNLSDLMIFVAHISAALNKPIGGGQALTNSILILVIFVTHITSLSAQPALKINPPKPIGGDQDRPGHGMNK